MSDSEIEDVFHGFPDDTPCPAGFSRYCPGEIDKYNLTILQP